MKTTCQICGKDANKVMFVKNERQFSQKVLVDLCSGCYSQNGISNTLKNNMFQSPEEKEAAFHERMRAGRQEYDAKIRSKSK